MNYTHGSKTVREGGYRTYDVNNPFCVFTKISNTPEYWKVKKMELLSRLDNLGPFNFFFTLSCADQRWTENFSAFLHELDIKVIYERNSLTPDIKTVVTVGEETMSLEDYLQDRRYCNESRHTYIRKTYCWQIETLTTELKNL